jgi:hypothetical protein
LASVPANPPWPSYGDGEHDREGTRGDEELVSVRIVETTLTAAIPAAVTRLRSCRGEEEHHDKRHGSGGDARTRPCREVPSMRAEVGPPVGHEYRVSSSARKVQEFNMDPDPPFHEGP